MELTGAQKESVRAWAVGGAGLSEIQNRLAEEFGLRLSYMDVRLLVLDLNATIVDKRAAGKAREATPAAAPVPDATQEEAFGEDDFAEDEPAARDALDDAAKTPAPGGGAVRVEVSRLTRPGFALTGDVTFSDGVKAQWGITARGELSLAAANPAYRPSPEDVRDFQIKLRNAVARQGY